MLPVPTNWLSNSLKKTYNTGTEFKFNSSQDSAVPKNCKERHTLFQKKKKKKQAVIFEESTDK